MTASTIKFCPASPPVNAISRSGLLGKLEQLDSKLVIVQAPAGYGKTTLMSQYYQRLIQRGESVAWLSLDKSDNDVVGFLNLLVESCVYAAANTGSSTQLKTSMESGDVADQFWRWLINAFTDEQMPGRLFIDEFELIDDPTILEIMSAGLHRLPAHRQIIIGSRKMPEFSLSKLRLNDDVTEIGLDELCFDKDESDQFYRDVHPTELSTDQVAGLYDQTDGWPAAIQISSLLLRHPGGAEGVIEDLDSNQLFSDYLVENILSSQSKQTREFLLKTSILDIQGVDICAHLSGADSAGDILEGLCENGLFTQRIGDKQYRYHKLFATTLRQHLYKAHPEDAKALHHKACNWFLERDKPEKAMEHARQAGDDDLLANMIEEHVMAFVYSSQLSQIFVWAATLPEERANALPNLQLACAWAHVLSRNTDGAGEALENLRCLVEEGNISPDYRNYYAPIVATNRVLVDDMEGIEDSIEKYLKKLPAEALFERMGLNNVLTYIHLTRNKFESARGLALAVQSSTPNQMSRYTLSYSYVSLAMQQVVLGQLRQARHSVGVVKELAASFELNDAVANSIPTPVWAELLYEENKTREAKLLLEQALPLIRSQALSDLLISAYITLARIQALDKEFHLALKTLEDLERIGYLDQQPRIIATARWELVRQYQLQGNLSRAEDIYHSIGAEGLSSRLPQYRFHPADIEADDITLVRLYLGQGELVAARSLLEQALSDTHKQRFYRRLKLQIMSSLIHQANGELELACNTLQQAIQSSLLEPFVRSFIDEGAPLVELLQALKKHLQESAPFSDKAAVLDYLQGLLVHAGDQLASQPAEPAQQALVEPLTKRELEMLQMITDGHSNKDIGNKLFVAESTVKWHLGNIYSKIGVKNRTQAIASGRKLGLIG